MALGFKKKSKASNMQRHVRMSPDTQKPASFQYSSNRMASERGFGRGAADRQQAYIKKLKHRLMRIPYVVGLLCLLVGGFYLSTLSTNPKLIIRGDQQLIRDNATYQQVTEDLLGSKLSYRSKFSFDSQEVAEQLQNKFPEFKTIEVSTSLLRHRPIIELDISAAAIVFVSGNDTYLLDERGVALFKLKETNHQVDTAKLPVLSDQTNFTVEVNKPALSSAQVSFVGEIIRQTAAKQLQVSSMELTSGGGQLDVRFKDVGYKIKFNFYEDPRRSAGAFLAAKEQIEKDGTNPVEYMDVRIPTRAYVR